LSTHGNLEDYVDVLLVFEEAIHFDDVGMVQVHLDFDFSDELLNNFLLNEHCFIYHFQCTDKATQLLSKSRDLYLAKNTFPYLPVPIFFTSSKLSRENDGPLLFAPMGLLLIQFFFFYSYLKF